MAWTARPLTSTVSETFSMWSAAVEAATTVVVAFAAAALPGPTPAQVEISAAATSPAAHRARNDGDLGRTMPPKARGITDLSAP